MSASDPLPARPLLVRVARAFLLAFVTAGMTAAAAQRAVAAVVPAEAAAPADPDHDDGDGDGDGKAKSGAKPQKGFSFRKEDTKVADKLSDFRRHSEKKSWELAFRAIGELAEADLKGMLPVGGGLSLPSRRQVWRALAKMPPDGREAYRLFHDAKARQLFEHAKSPTGTDELATLRKIYDQYFVTSVGDQAADRLGDLYFASGEFAPANAVWLGVLEYHPDTAIPKSRLRAKRCAALARAGRWPEFELAAAELTGGGTGGDPVVVGGRPVPAGEYVQSLRASASAAPEPRPATSQPAAAGADPSPEPAGRIALPAGAAPLWQARFDDGRLAEQAAQALQQMGWGTGPDVFGAHVPPSATDGKRVYLNWFGVAFALDARTGKLLWRSRKFGDVGDNAQSFVQGGVDVNRYHLVVAGDRVFITGVPLGEVNTGRGGNGRIVCHHADTGAVVWSSKSGTASGYNIAGQPIVVGQMIYVAAQKTGQQEMHLLALEPATGKLAWTVTLGTPQAGTDYRGNTQAPAPALVHHAGTVYVLTNNGALLAVDANDRRLAWALSYDPPPIVANDGMFFMPQAAAPIPAQGAAVVRGSTLYLKETNGPALHAVDLAGPSVAWSRPADAATTIAAIDDRQVYLLGPELSAVDVNTRAMRWSTKVPVRTGSARAVRGGDALYVFSARGVYEFDAATGDPAARVFRTADADAVGGALWRSADRLFTVSNLAVTAYPVAPAAGGGQGAGSAR